jgi:hypothetical protein
MSKNNFLPDHVFHPKNEADLWHEASFPLNASISDWQQVCNSMGFRGEEFIEKADIVGLGCSFTFGLGVPEGKTWGHIVSGRTNMTYHNLAGAGKSIAWSVNNFFSYVNKFGNPKIVLCLFPGFLRQQITSRSSKMIPAYNQFPKLDLDQDKIIRYSIYPGYVYVEQEKYVGKPFLAEYTMPKEMGMDLSIQYIKMLEAYCNASNIKLIWTTWSRQEEIWLDKNIKETGFKNYVSSEMKYWHNSEGDLLHERLCNKYIEYYNLENASGYITPEHICGKDKKCLSYIDCHNEYKDEENFDVASDAHIGPGRHWGMHRHIHIAETFLSGLNEL